MAPTHFDEVVIFLWIQIVIWIKISCVV